MWPSIYPSIYVDIRNTLAESYINNTVFVFIVCLL